MIFNTVHRSNFCGIPTTVLRTPRQRTTVLAVFEIEGLVDDHKYRGAAKEGHYGEIITMLVDLKESIVLTSYRHRASPNVFHPHFKNHKKHVQRTRKRFGKE